MQLIKFAWMFYRMKKSDSEKNLNENIIFQIKNTFSNPQVNSLRLVKVLAGGGGRDGSWVICNKFNTVSIYEDMVRV